MSRAAVLLALALGCSAPATPPDLAAAERLERGGRGDEALAAYRRAERSCRREREAYRRRLLCAQAHLGRAELLATLERPALAIAAFAAIPAALPDDPAAGARATLRAGELSLPRDPTAAYGFLWRVVTDYPDEAFAADALKLLLRDGRRRDAAQLERELGRLLAPLGGSALGDNLHLALAELAEARGDRAAARAALDALVARERVSGLVDDALWNGARLSREMGDPRGAEARLVRLLGTREVAWGTGSYFSVWLDDAELALGRLRRDELGDPAGALTAFARLPRHYPTSTLRDDALWETARTHAATGDRPRACRALAELGRRFPDCRWQLAEAPALARSLACQPR